MKIEIKKETVKVFDPITLSFVIESKRELQFFLSFLNASGNNLAEFVNQHIPVSNVKGGKADQFDSGECFCTLKSKQTWDKLIVLYNEL